MKSHPNLTKMISVLLQRSLRVTLLFPNSPPTLRKGTISTCPFLTLYTNTSRSGLVVSMFTTGAFFGAGFAGPSGDYLGRRKTISLGALLFCLGGALQTGARTLPYLYSGRFFAGFG